MSYRSPVTLHYIFCVNKVEHIYKHNLKNEEIPRFVQEIIRSSFILWSAETETFDVISQ